MYIQQEGFLPQAAHEAPAWRSVPGKCAVGVLPVREAGALIRFKALLIVQEGCLPQAAREAPAWQCVPGRCAAGAPSQSLNLEELELF